MFRRLIVGLCSAGLLAACTSSPSSGSSPTGAAAPPATTSGSTSPSPNFDPANFTTTIDNPYFPLKPGTHFVYTGVKDGKSQRDDVIVTGKTKVIMGVTTTVLEDTSTHDGQLIEKTEDWYVQDKQGNVWYFGEDTAEYENGKVVSTEGTWEAGKDGAVAGIIMPANPQVPMSYRQEYYAGQAEDMAWVVDLASKAKVPFGTFDDALLTIEWSRLDPSVVDKKLYEKGVGLVLEASASGPKETLLLVRVIGG